MTTEKLKAEVHDPSVREIIPEDTVIEQVAAGFGFTEGPVWCGNYLLFSDIPASRISKLSFTKEGPEVTTWRTPTGNSNGLTLDNAKRVIVCEHSGRRVSLIETDGSIRTLASEYKGKRLNSPNDVVVRSDGSIYFTDPPYGLRNHEDEKELPYHGVYRIAPDGELELIVDDFDRPNGLAFSPDESILYINDSVRQHIRAFKVAKKGGVSNGRVLIEMHGQEPGVPDGMKVDQEGNIYCTGSGGFWVMTPQGKCLARFFPPELPSNFAFGGDDWKTLFITARTSVYRMKVGVAGIPVGVF
jgi:gluconolactonase